MSLGIQYLGFVIPFYIMNTLGQRWRTPGRGVCAECGEHKDRVYLTGDDRPYCSDCIMFDLAEADPSDEQKREQKHPPPDTSVAEVIYEKVKYAVNDGADLRTYERMFA